MYILNCSGSLTPLVQLGVKPVFVDVELSRYVPSVDTIVNAITPKTKMIWIPNLIGSKPDWNELRRRTNLPLWEDSADTITLTEATDVSTTSFYASHVITCACTFSTVLAPLLP